MEGWWRRWQSPHARDHRLRHCRRRAILVDFGQRQSRNCREGRRLWWHLLIDKTFHFIFKLLLLLSLTLLSPITSVPCSLSFSSSLTYVITIVEDINGTRSRPGPEARKAIIGT